LNKDHRTPVLLLRSFADDEKYQYGSYSIFDTSLEARLAEYFIRVGPFIAVGAPGEKLPAIGAARASLSEAQWRDRVTEWIANARVIVVMAGISTWVNWEMRQVIDREYSSKMILLFPPRAWWSRVYMFQSSLVRETERLKKVQEVFSQTAWAPALARLTDAHRIRSVVFNSNGSITVVSSRSRNRSSYHLAAVLAHYLLPAEQAQRAARPVPTIERYFGWKAILAGSGVATALSVAGLFWLGEDHNDATPAAQRSTQVIAYAMVNPDKLLLRKSPDEAGTPVAVLPKDLEVRVIREVNDGWAEIEAPGSDGRFFRGYANNSVLTVTATALPSARFMGYATVNLDKLLLRSEPNEKGKAVATMPKGLEVKVIRRSGMGGIRLKFLALMEDFFKVTYMTLH
jgi:hypothetical protein